MIDRNLLMILRENGNLLLIRVDIPEISHHTTNSSTELVAIVERSEKTTYFQLARASDKKDLIAAYDIGQHLFCWCMYTSNAADKPLLEVKAKYKMILKRFDQFRLLGRDVVLLSEYWDIWIINV